MVRDDIDVDALIAEKVMGWKCADRDCDGKFLTRCGACGRHGHGNCYGNGEGAIQVSCIDRGHRPSYSSDISAAWEVVEKMKDRYDRSTVEWVTFAAWCGELGDMTPSGICLAALKAVGVEVPA